MTITLPQKAIAGVYAVLIAGLLLQLGMLLYVEKYPEVPAAAISQRTTAGYAWLYALRVFKWDDESDLTQVGLSQDALINACRFRADIGIIHLKVMAEFAGIILVAHYLVLKTRTKAT